MFIIFVGLSQKISKIYRLELPRGSTRHFSKWLIPSLEINFLWTLVLIIQIGQIDVFSGGSRISQTCWGCGPTQKTGCQPIMRTAHCTTCSSIFPKSCMKMRKNGLSGGTCVFVVSLGPPMFFSDASCNFDEQYCNKREKSNNFFPANQLLVGTKILIMKLARS